MWNYRMAPTRRQFTLGLAGAALAFPGTRNSIYNPKLVADTAIWLNEATARRKSPSEILDEALGALQKTGYRRVQLVEGFLTADLRARTLARVNRLGLEPSILCVSGPLDSGSEAQKVRFEISSLARLFTGRSAFIAFTAPATADGTPRSDEQLRTLAYQLNLLGQDLERCGIELLLNHEAAEMRNGAREWQYLVAHTEPKLVSLCVDVETAARAGANPWALIDSAGGRLRSVHLRNTRYGVDQEMLGAGDIDLGAIAALLRQEQYDGYLVVELRFDPAAEGRRSLPEALARSRWYMQEVFGSRPGAAPVDMGPHVRIPH